MMKPTTTEIVLSYLCTMAKDYPQKQYTMAEIIHALQADHPQVNAGTVKTFLHKEIKPRGIIESTGIKSGRHIYYRICAPADDILDLFYGRKKSAPQSLADDISDEVFGKKVFRYWSLLENKISVLQARHRDEVIGLRETLEEKCDLVRELTGKVKYLENKINKKVNRTLLLEVKNENKRLKERLDKVNCELANIKRASGDRKGWSLSEIMRIS